MTELPDILHRRIDALSLYRKGEGLTLGKLVSTPDREDLFGHDDPFESRLTIVNTVLSEQELSLFALANALNISESPSTDNLMGRRADFLKKFQMSMRTLTTREEEGVQVAAYLLPRFINK